MTYRTLEVSFEGPIAQLKLSRPEALNSLTREFWSELPDALRAIDAEGKARVIVLSSTGKHFTAGMDLAVFGGAGIAPAGEREVGRTREALRHSVLKLQDSLSALERVRVPVLAAIQGGCVGGGVDMVSACDARYCSDDAFFCVQEINIGMTADLGTLQRLPKIMPSGIVRELAYTGRRLPAARAKEVGLVNETFRDHESLLAGVMEIAREIAERSPLAVCGSKEMLNFARDHSVADSLQYMAVWQTGMFQPADMIESFSAKAQKRAAVFEDLAPIKKPFE
ncbi:MAG TPA: crotonase/enoyl-CoA hydratase family protein [Polyangiales bacterium]|nr:crotonase/enoyl-CoA hydratase family protein [Polyangiales bacterium]